MDNLRHSDGSLGARHDHVLYDGGFHSSLVGGGVGRDGHTHHSGTQSNLMKKKTPLNSKVGQGFNDSRGEIPDMKDIPKHNGQNLNNDPAHHRANENQLAPPDTAPKSK